MELIDNAKNTWDGLCGPAQVYLALQVVGIVLSALAGGVSGVGAAVISLIVALVWTWILQKICDAGYRTAAWILVFLPLILLLVVFVLGIIGIESMM